MKKALCFFFAIVFVCCVIVHGKNERFSLEAMITNLTNFQDMPSFEDIAECWSGPYRTYDASDMPSWIDLYTLESIPNQGTVFVYKGKMPLAYEEDGSLTKRHPYTWEVVYNANGTLNQSDDPDSPDGISYPIIMQHGKKVFYESYSGDDPVLSFFDSVKAFFLRLGDTMIIIAEMITSVFDNVQYLLPWNNTVPKGV